jgi:hypothetical protein
MPVILATEIRRVVVRSQPQANSSRDPISKNHAQKRAGGVTQGIGPKFKLQYCKTKPMSARIKGKYHWEIQMGKRMERTK